MARILKPIISIAIFYMVMKRFFLDDYEQNEEWLDNVLELAIHYVVLPIFSILFIVWFESSKTNNKKSERLSVNILQSFVNKLPLFYKLLIKLLLYAATLYVCFYWWIQLFT